MDPASWCLVTAVHVHSFFLHLIVFILLFLPSQEPVTWLLMASCNRFPKTAMWELSGRIITRKQVTGMMPAQGRADGRQEERGKLFPAQASVPLKSFDRSQRKISQMGPAHAEILSCSHSPAGGDGGFPMSDGKRNRCICGAEPSCHQAGSEFRAKDNSELQTLTFCVIWPRVG